MKMFLIACVVAIVIAAIGGVALNGIQQPAEKAFTTADSVRLGV